jgi:hypothetical protein
MVSQFRAKADQYIHSNAVARLCFASKQHEYRQKVVNGWRAFELAHERNLVPTPYFFEALDYAAKAKKLQAAALTGKRVPKVGDPLMEAIPIYNTVQRRFAGFSNVLEHLWYGVAAPKYIQNSKAGRAQPLVSWENRNMKDDHYLEMWLYITLAHRITGSGASFEHDHGFRNNRIIEMQAVCGDVDAMSSFLGDYDGPIFTSIGNQIPPFPPMGGREYLKVIAPEFVRRVATTLSEMARMFGPMGIKPAVDTVLSIHSSLGCKQFKFVLTAWVMDMAEYLPHLVDPNSDCYHGKNAIEAMNICFERLPSMKLQDFYDTATRLFADVTGTKPMDVEDASPGCDLIRWIENYVPKKGFQHVIDQGIFNGSSLVWKAGRQPT